MCQAGSLLSEVRERTGEARLLQLWFGVCVSAPDLPLSLSLLAPSGTHTLARPQEPGSQDQGKRRGKANVGEWEGNDKMVNFTEEF